MLLEGKFQSLYRNRIPPEIRDNRDIGFIELSETGKMIVVGDGDIIKNQVRKTGDVPTPYPLGYDRYTGQTFGNKEFILNAMNYLIDENGLISIRSRELKLRLLDRTRINDNKLFWQVINTVLPVILVIILGLIMYFVRKKKYA